MFFVSLHFHSSVHLDIVDEDFDIDFIQDYHFVNKKGKAKKQDVLSTGVSIRSRPSLMKLFGKLGHGDTIWIFDWNEFTSNVHFLSFIIKYFKCDIEVHTCSGQDNEFAIHMKAVFMSQQNVKSFY